MQSKSLVFSLMVLFAAGGCGLAQPGPIPGDAALVLRIECRSPVEAIAPFRLGIVLGGLPVDPTLGCEPIPCFDAMFECELECASSATGDCDIPSIQRQICACLTQLPTFVPIECTPNNDGSIVVKGLGPAGLLVMGRELGLDSAGACMGLPLRPGCPVANLCDGVVGNERERYEAGLRISVEYRLPPTPTPPAGCQLAGPLVQRSVLEVECLEPLCGELYPDYSCGAFTFLLAPPAPDTAARCEAQPLTIPPYVHCDVPCAVVVPGMVGPICDAMPGFAKRLLMQCINEQGAGRFCAWLNSVGGLVIDGAVPFQVVVISGDPGEAPSRALPVWPECPVNNLCDALLGNERAEHTSGLAIRMLAPPRPSPTPTRPERPTDTPSERTETPVPPTSTPILPCRLDGPVMQETIVRLDCLDPLCSTNPFPALCEPFFFVLGPGVDDNSVERCRRRPDMNNTLAMCQVDCYGGVWDAPDPSIPPIPSCDYVRERILVSLIHCINASAPGRVCAERLRTDLIRITATEPFEVFVVLPSAGQLPVLVEMAVWPECPVNNLCDALSGNEREPHRAGLAVSVLGEPPATPTGPPRPTDTPGGPCELIGPVVQRSFIDVCCTSPVGCVSPEEACRGFQVILEPLRVNDGMLPGCEPMTYLTPLAVCDVPCNWILPAIGDPCERIAPAVERSLIECINASAGGRVCATLMRDGTVRLESVVPFAVIVDSPELGLPPSFAPAGLPVRPRCPVNNLCNGRGGDERLAHRAGLCLTMVGEPRPTWTPTETPVGGCQLIGPVVQREHIDICCAEPAGCQDASIPCPPFRVIVQPRTNTGSIDRCAPQPVMLPLAVVEVPCLAPQLGSPLPICDVWPGMIEHLLVEKINRQADGRVCATRMRDGTVRIEAIVPFVILVEGPELGPDPDPAGTLRVGWPVWPECPVNNLCNDRIGDQREPHVNGLCVTMLGAPRPTPTPTVEGEVTATPTNTRRPTPTPPGPCELIGPVAYRALLDVACLEPLCGPNSNPGQLFCSGFAVALVPMHTVSADRCAPQTIGIRPLALCEVPCLVGEDGTLVPNPCEFLPDLVKARLIACINASAQGRVCASRAEDGRVLLEAVVPIQVLIIGRETGLPWDMGLPVWPECPVNNLCDGLVHNERLPHRAGLALSLDGIEVPTPVATPEPTETPGEPGCVLIGPPRMSAVLKLGCIDPWSGDAPFRLHVLPRFAFPRSSDDVVPCRPIRLWKDFGHCDIGTPLTDGLCPTWAYEKAGDIAACINASRPGQRGLVCAYPLEGRGPAVRIDAVVPILLAVSGAETGLPEGEALLVLPDCPVNNLFDGLRGNERAPYETGLSLEIEYMLPPRPTPVPRCDCVPAADAGDWDGDGLPNEAEGGNPPAFGMTNAFLADSDGDGLLDSEEGSDTWSGLSFDPRAGDSYGDGLRDGVGELLFGAADAPELLGPEDLSDGDGDGLPWILDPDDADPDVDDDGVGDGYEALRCGAWAVVDPNTTAPLGDVNCDGVVTNLDALYLQAFFLELVGPEIGAFSNGDVNRDGIVSNLDALIVQSRFQDFLAVIPL